MGNILKSLHPIIKQTCQAIQIMFVCVGMLSGVRLFPALRSVDCQASLSMEFASKNTGTSCHFLLQWIFHTQGWNQYLLHFLDCRWDSSPLSQRGSPIQIMLVTKYFVIKVLGGGGKPSCNQGFLCMHFC